MNELEKLSGSGIGKTTARVFNEKGLNFDELMKYKDKTAQELLLAIKSRGITGIKLKICETILKALRDDSHLYYDANKSYTSLKNRLKNKEVLNWEKSEFIQWYNDTLKEQKGKCCYCEMSFDDIRKLKDKMGKGYFKSGRGGNPEIEKFDPNGHYKPSNCALACYICNNAKSDIFNKNEFEWIAAVIRKAIIKVLE